MNCYNGNTVSGYYAYNAIWGGINNCVCLGSQNAIVGGQANCISGCVFSGGEYILPTGLNFIGGGVENCIFSVLSVGGEIFKPCSQDANRNAIGGGESNRISGDSRLGESLLISDNVIGGGCCNLIRLASCSGIIGTYISVVEYDNSFNFKESGSPSSVCQSCFDNISKTSSSFRINHPDPEKRFTHELWHTNVESPNAGDNIYRFQVTVRGGAGEVDLPSYYRWLNQDDQVWVSPADGFGNAYGTIDESRSKVTVKADADGIYHVLVIGERADEAVKKHWRGVLRIE